MFCRLGSDELKGLQLSIFRMLEYFAPRLVRVRTVYLIPVIFPGDVNEIDPMRNCSGLVQHQSAIVDYPAETFASEPGYIIEVKMDQHIVLHCSALFCIVGIR